MLKKLVKYGNSKALVLDRAILELLNIREGALVKLKTDGKSLTITPAELVEKDDVVLSDFKEVTYAADETVST
ncbi:MAG: AbrB/MazE/SpoVT family DNA-binding domain-containing protein [Gammaproteobacteria bacterium]|nr:AbrB/MazE/SpoVT family DNA-binding domain-containing protein [Gammaproteobacteria bacterium]